MNTAQFRITINNVQSLKFYTNDKNSIESVCFFCVQFIPFFFSSFDFSNNYMNHY